MSSNFTLLIIESSELLKTCKTYTKAYLNANICKEEVACHLITIHNIHYLLNLMKKLRDAIINDNLENFVKYIYFSENNNINDNYSCYCHHLNLSFVIPIISMKSSQK